MLPSLTSGILSWELDSLVDSFSFFPTTTEASSSSPRVHLFFSSRWKSGSYLKLFLSALTFCSTLTTAQLKSASFEELTAVVSQVTHPWGWQLYHSRGKKLLSASLSHGSWVGGVDGGTIPLMLHKERGCCCIIMPSQHRVPVLKSNNKPNPPLYLLLLGWINQRSAN